MLMKCQCRPRPRFFLPGSATSGDHDASSSNEDHGLRESDPYAVLESRSHSRPGGLSSCQYSFGKAESTSNPDRNSKSMKKRLRKWVMTTHIGKKPGTRSAPLLSTNSTPLTRGRKAARPDGYVRDRQSISATVALGQSTVSE